MRNRIRNTMTRPPGPGPHVLTPEERIEMEHATTEADAEIGRVLYERDAERLEEVRRRHRPVVSSHRCAPRWCEQSFLLHEIDRLCALLDQRDRFIRDQGLWMEFVKRLPPARTKASDPPGPG